MVHNLAAGCRPFKVTDCDLENRVSLFEVPNCDLKDSALAAVPNPFRFALMAFSRFTDSATWPLSDTTCVSFSRTPAPAVSGNSELVILPPVLRQLRTLANWLRGV